MIDNTIHLCYTDLAYSYCQESTYNNEKSKDKNGKVLQNVESIRKDGRYTYRYVGIDGKRKSIYAKTLDELREKRGRDTTAELLGEFISLVPDGVVPEWKWFFDEERIEAIERIDAGISDYPDGLMTGLYIQYISVRENAEKLLNGLA